jgi:hypothetical protein
MAVLAADENAIADDCVLPENRDDAGDVERPFHVEPPQLPNPNPEATGADETVWASSFDARCSTQRDIWLQSFLDFFGGCLAASRTARFVASSRSQSKTFLRVFCSLRRTGSFG